MTVRLEQRVLHPVVTAFESAATSLEVASATKTGRVFHRDGAAVARARLEAASVDLAAGRDALAGATHAHLQPYVDELRGRVDDAARALAGGDLAAGSSPAVRDAADGLRDIVARMRTSDAVLTDADRAPALHGASTHELLDGAVEDLRYVDWLGASHEVQGLARRAQVPMAELAQLGHNAGDRMAAAREGLVEALPAAGTAFDATTARLGEQLTRLDAAAAALDSTRGVRGLERARHYPQLGQLARVRAELTTFRDLAAHLQATTVADAI